MHTAVMDTALALETLSRQASLYTIVLNGRIDRDLSRRPLTSDFADIYEGTLLPDGTKVAVKTIHADPPSNQGAIEHFLKEIRTWSKLSHENVEELIGISTDFSLTVSLIFPWRAKGNAIDYVQNESVDPRPLLADAAEGLFYLHNHASGPIYHGDLRGSNIVISDDGHALLTDFGISSLVDSSFSLPVSTTTTGAINWTAPECLEDYLVCAEQDVWAYGMTALELFTRKPPFHEMKVITSVMRRIMAGPPDRPSDKATHSRLTDGWWLICNICWNHDPSSRPTIGEILSRIDIIEEESRS